MNDSSITGSIHILISFFFFVLVIVNNELELHTYHVYTNLLRKSGCSSIGMTLVSVYVNEQHEFGGFDFYRISNIFTQNFDTRTCTHSRSLIKTPITCNHIYWKLKLLSKKMNFNRNKYIHVIHSLVGGVPSMRGEVVVKKMVKCIRRKKETKKTNDKYKLNCRKKKLCSEKVRFITSPH